MAVGERSMLSVFQDVAKAIKELPVGRLASFDQLYDGISGVIRADKKQTMATAQNQVSDLELRILKACSCSSGYRSSRARHATSPSC